MPPIRTSLSSTNYYVYIVAFIQSLGEVMPTYSHCSNKKLVYITIAAPSSRQPSFYSKCTSTNIYSSYNVRSVSNTKYTFLRLILAMSQLLGRNT